MTKNTNYYETTAYDSTNKRDLPTFNRTELGIAERTVRKYPLHTNGCQCREYLAESSPIGTVLEFQNLNEKSKQELLERNLHEYFQWQTGSNMYAVVESIVYVAMWFWLFGGIPGGITTGLIKGFNNSWLLIMLIGFVAPFTIWGLGKIALKRGWFKNDNNIMFNRRTGMITFPKGDERISLPFDEFDPYLSTAMTTAATTNRFLRLVHRYSDNLVTQPTAFSQQWELMIAWEDIQHFMDISKSLPDVPTYDFAREHDPVSAAYDKKYNRPKDYWKNIKITDIEKMQLASIQAGKKFPWGQTREQEITSGWKPSGYGEGDWRETKKDDAA